MTLDYAAWASGGLVLPRRDDWLGPFRLGPNDGAANGIYEGDARKLAKWIPDESIDLIFTDPVYDRIDDYRWLAETAARVLKPGGAVLVWMSIGRIPEQCAAMNGFLIYRWQLIEYRPNEERPRHSPNGRSTYSSLMWWERTKTILHKKTVDVKKIVVKSTKSGQQVYHQWGKSEEITTYYMRAFSLDGGLVFDPFTGGGTVPAVCKQLGRRYLAFEIDPATCHAARQRVRDTQPPLFVLEPEQLALPEVAA